MSEHSSVVGADDKLHTASPSRSLALALSKMGHHWRTLSRQVASSYLILKTHTGCSVENKL